MLIICGNLHIHAESACALQISNTVELRFELSNHADFLVKYVKYFLPSNPYLLVTVVLFGPGSLGDIVLACVGSTEFVSSTHSKGTQIAAFR